MWDKCYKKEHYVVVQGIGISYVWIKMIQIREEMDHGI